MTSNDVTRILSRLLNVQKVGHTGTLDPGAAGVLPICLGKATRLSEYLISLDKTYRCELVLGKETDTLDSYGNITSQSVHFPDEQTLKAAILEFKGEILQTAPLFSAVKVDGSKLYDLARKGLEVKPQVRKVEIKNISFITYTAPDRVLFDVECSKGTYIRSLCSDIGKKLLCGAYMGFLLRTKSGTFTIENSYTLDEVTEYCNSNTIEEILTPMDKALENFSTVVISSDVLKKILNGNAITVDNIVNKHNEGYTALVKVYCQNQFIGIGRFNIDSSLLLMEKLLYDN